MLTQESSIASVCKWPALFSEVATVLKLTLVMPATNALSEMSFSALRRIKNYLYRSTMTQKRMNKEDADNLNLIDVANELCHLKLSQVVKI